MPSNDISRFLLQPQKHYSSLRMQQGRIPLDSDWNEAARIDDLDAQQAVLDILGPKGTANDGFRLTAFSLASVELPDGSTQDTYDVSFDAGSMFLGGLRFETSGDLGPPSSPGLERYLQQVDWVQVDADAANLPTLPNLAAGEVQNDLVVLCAWEQSVSAVEDAELLEVALGGPDTSTRVRRMRRVQIRQATESGDCKEAFDAYMTELADGRATYNPATCELESNGRLAVRPLDTGAPEDPCRPDALGGYLGAENQALRVQMVSDTEFVWGYDNASPLYRVELVAGDDDPPGVVTKVRFLNLPKDQAAQPLANQTVEILRWGSYLPNEEKAAERAGHLDTVQTSYDPDSQTLTLADGVPEAWVQWFDVNGHSKFERGDDPEGERRYFYLRLWNTGDPARAARRTITGTVTLEDPANWVDLGIGLEVGFEALGLDTDHWVVAARPSTPDRVVPWALETGLRPMGYRTYYAPLGFVRFEAIAAQSVARQTLEPSLVDCRKTYRRLCDLDGCCTISVGDGSTSFGETNDLQAAIDGLPPTGGKICLLPGVHTVSTVSIKERTGIKIEGCGPRTIVQNAVDTGVALNAAEPPPVIEICESTDIELCQFTVRGHSIGCVRAEKSTDIRLLHMRFDCEPGSANPRVGVDTYDVNFLRVEDCTVNMAPVYSPYPAMYVNRGFSTELRRNRIICPEPTSIASTPWGGMQLAGLLSRVRIYDNVIFGGHGHGITLGDLLFINETTAPPIGGLTDFYAAIDGVDPPFAWWFRTPAGQALTDGGATVSGPQVTNLPQAVTVGDPAETFTPFPDGQFVGLEIVGNDVRLHGSSGIASAAFWAPNLEVEPIPPSFEIFICELRRNLVEQNLQLEPFTRPPTVANSGLYGGVVLSTVTAWNAAENRITENGFGLRTPLVGMGATLLFNSSFTENFVLGNGALPQGSAVAVDAGPRGGLWLGLAARVVGLEGGLSELEPAGFTRFTSVQVQGNQIEGGLGRSLTLTSFGPATVQSNSLTSFGAPAPEVITGVSMTLSVAGGGGATPNPVAVGAQVLGFGFPVDILPGSADFDDLGLTVFRDGQILFEDNYVSLDWFAERPQGLSFCGAFLQSLGTLSVQGNHFTACLHQPEIDGNSQADFFDEMLTGPTSRSALATHVWAVAGAGVQVIGNTIQEGQTDALFSLVSGTPDLVGAPDMTTVVHNHTTHCILGADPSEDNKIFLGCPPVTGYTLSAGGGISPVEEFGRGGVERRVLDDGSERRMGGMAGTTRVSRGDAPDLGIDAEIDLDLAAAPTVTSIQGELQAAGCAGHFTVLGSGFTRTDIVEVLDSDGNVVARVSPNFVSAERLVIRWIAPVGSGMYSVRVLRAFRGGSSATLANALNVLSCPVASTFSFTPPSTGTVVSVTVTGSGFDAQTVFALDHQTPPTAGLPVSNINIVSTTQATFDIETAGAATGTYRLRTWSPQLPTCVDVLPNAYTV